METKKIQMLLIIIIYHAGTCNNSTHLALNRASKCTRETCWVAADGRHRLSVCKAANERLGKHSLQLHGIQSQFVFSTGLKGMQGWVIISLHCNEKMIVTLLTSLQKSKLTIQKEKISVI